MVGTLADCTTTSFFPAKPLGCYGDGGAIFTNDKQLTDKLVSIRNHGQGTHKYDIVRVGINGRLDTIQAAILSEKLTLFAAEIDMRQRVAKRYTDALTEVAITPKVQAGNISVWAQYTLLINNRDTLANALKADGIPTAVYYPKAMHQQAPYQNYLQDPIGLPVTEQLCQQVISLPMHPYLTKTNQDKVIQAIITHAKPSSQVA